MYNNDDDDAAGRAYLVRFATGANTTTNRRRVTVGTFPVRDMVQNTYENIAVLYDTTRRENANSRPPSAIMRVRGGGGGA